MFDSPEKLEKWWKFEQTIALHWNLHIVVFFYKNITWNSKTTFWRTRI